MIRRRLNQARAGFSLVELSIVIVIVSIVATSGLEAAAIYLNHTATQVTQERLNTIDAALRRYFAVYNRLPCPGDRDVIITNGITHNGYGKEYCNAGIQIGGTSIYQGMVPVRDLNLPMETAIDGYGQRINYFVTIGLTTASTFASTPEAIDVRTGILALSCSTYCQDIGMAAYFVFSNGADKRGGISTLGNTIPCIPVPGASYNNRIDTQNCNYTCTIYSNCSVAAGVSIAANVVYDSRYNTGAEHGDPSAITTNGTTVEQNYFDDLVVWRSKGQL